MKLRIKKRKKGIEYIQTLELNKFLVLNKEADSYPARYRLLSHYYNELFRKAMPKGQPLELIEACIAYELYARDYKKAGKRLPEKLKHNLIASKKFSLRKFDPGIRSLLKTTINVEKKKEEINMTNKKGVSSRNKVAHLYLSLFDRQSSERLSDKEIAKEIKSRTGSKPSLKNVASYRCLYNQGKIKGQTKRPPEKLKAFREVRAKKLKLKKGPKDQCES